MEDKKQERRLKRFQTMAQFRTSVDYSGPDERDYLKQYDDQARQLRFSHSISLSQYDDIISNSHLREATY